jgi:hypothetical protein
LCDALDRVLLVLPALSTLPPPLDDCRVEPGAAADAHAELGRALASAASALDGSLAERLALAARQLSAIASRLRTATRSARPLANAPQAPQASAGPRAAEWAMNETESLADRVRFGASAPPSAKLDSSFIARFIAYASTDAAAARDSLHSDAGGSKIVLDIGSAIVARGTPMTILLEARGLKIEDEDRFSQSLIWTGEPVKLLFVVSVPADVGLESTILKFDVSIDGFVLARIRLEVALHKGADTASLQPTLHQSMDTLLARTAFASYSSKDRDRVLDRVAAIRIAAGIDVFLDCRDLNPGQPWTPRLEQEIDRRDTFMLFWSRAAAQSRWVTWEWERALDTKGAEHMQIHPLENGVAPPRRLADLHMADAYMDHRSTTRGNP